MLRSVYPGHITFNRILPMSNPIVDKDMQGLAWERRAFSAPGNRESEAASHLHRGQWQWTQAAKRK